VKQIAANAGTSVGYVDNVLHDDLKMRRVSWRWVSRMLTDEKRLHAPQCVRQCYHVTRVWIVLSFHELSQWMIHGCRCSILKPNGNRLNGSTPTHRHRRNFGLSPVLICFGTAKAWYLLIAFPRVQQWRVRLNEDVLRSFFQHCVKNGPQRLQLCSFITTTLLLIGRLVFTSFSTTTTLKLLLMLRTHLTSHQAIFGCFQYWRTLRGRTFSCRSALAIAIFQWSHRTPKEAFAAAMQSWRQRCEKYVRLQDDYVEKLLHFQLPRMSNFLK